ncbi:MAG TPA: CBS and ACT domain-containing protein [Candidatus Ornithospirochaeta avicola]|uniref:CBS and ACT domain-containing protein n=1 Tax=Candidatus Ornithospirochaeta avicola TaxID=2840896 RepID=A0A9D1PTM4_9SPIO|nr:CBS and ACT domain-containing protein [Candidatus Ornithospirochaeta avicola]
MTVESRMTRNPVTIGPDQNVTEASELMKKEKVHRLPVLDKDRNLIGIITEKDILHATPSPASSLSIHEMAYLLSKLTVRKLMSKNPVTISKDVPVEEAARFMVDQDLSCLPVIEDGKLIGIVSKSDLFKILIELFGARNRGVRVTFLVDDRPGLISNVSKALSDHGLDIIAFGTFMGTDVTNRVCTLKVATENTAEVLNLLKPYVKEIQDIRVI